MQGINDILKDLKDENRLRTIPRQPAEGFIDLCSNDYLGLAERYGEFLDEFHSRFQGAPFSSSASRLLSSRQEYHFSLEDYLESLYCKPALLFNSGYHANVGCITALARKDNLFICDKLIHASIIDGLKMAGAEFKRFPHNDIDKLTSVLNKSANDYRNIVVVIESIYSMDGDVAPLKEIIDIKKDFPNLTLYVDEAHAFGVRGARGLGLAEELGLIDNIDIIIGTFGKAAASSGAFVLCNESLKSYFINSARSFIFSTALPPINVAWSQLMVEKITQMAEERNYLGRLSQFFNAEIEKITGISTGSSSQIIPLITGDAALAIKIAEILKRNNILALPIRRPTVPPGGERIRFSLNVALTKGDIESVIDVLKNTLQ